MYILNHYTMKTFIQYIIFAILTFTSPFLDAQEKIIVCPNELQQEWANAEIGVIIHFDMPVFHPDYNWRQFGTHPSPSTFNPSSLRRFAVFCEPFPPNTTRQSRFNFL